jgi:hypothetical protein
MKRNILFTLLFLFIGLVSKAQTVIDIPIEQNPPLKASAQTIAVEWQDGGVILVADKLISGGDGNYTYLWTDDNGLQIGTESKITATLPGNYYLKVTDGNGCQLSILYKVNNTTIINSTSTSKGGISMALYGRTLRITSNSSFSLKIIDESGSCISMKTYSSGKKNISLSSLPTGNFIFYLLSNGKVMTAKYLIK